MQETKRICSVCGCEFTTTAANAKYCSAACKSAGTHKRRKEWEDKSGYREKQRRAMYEYRQKQAKEANEAREAAAKTAQINANRRQQYRQKKEREALETKAKAGDNLARMAIAAVDHGITSPYYWEAYKEYEIDFYERAGYKAKSYVNDISVYDPDFVLKVVITIQELKHIEIKSHRGAALKSEDDSAV